MASRLHEVYPLRDSLFISVFNLIAVGAAWLMFSDKWFPKDVPYFIRILPAVIGYIYLAYRHFNLNISEGMMSGIAFLVCPMLATLWIFAAGIVLRFFCRLFRRKRAS